MSLPDLTGFGQSDLDSLLSALRDEAQDIQAALSDATTADDADLDRLAAVADEVDAVIAALASLATKSAERAAKVAALAARITPAQLSEDEEVVVEEVVVEEVVVEEAAPVVEEAVVAGVNTGLAHPAPRRVASFAPKPKAPSSTPAREVAIVAAAGVKVDRTKTLSLGDFVKPAMKSWESYQGFNGIQSDDLFTLQAPARDPRMVADGSNDQSVMEYATDVTRLARRADAKPNQTGIVAAGGWCAPAEQRFDICTLASLDGILNVPTIGMPRGSISYFRQLDYSTVAAAIAAGEFCFTNAQLVATPPVVKPCFEIPCATPVTATLDACGLCIRAGLLQVKAFPELIAAWLHLALIAHAHFLNARNIAQMVAGSGPLVAETATFGAIAPFLDSVYLRAAQYRLLNGMAENAPLEAVGPFWAPWVFAVDQERRQFDNDADNDWAADIAQNANVHFQWVKDFQDGAFLTAAAAGQWPATIEYLLFAPGAWVRGAEDIISVSTLVDSTLLQTNRVQLLFIETATVMLPWCGPSTHYSVPICPSGATAGPIAATPGTYSCSL